MKRIGLDPADIHTTFWAPTMPGGAVRGRLRHRPSGAQVDFTMHRGSDPRAGAMHKLTVMVAQGRGK